MHCKWVSCHLCRPVIVSNLPVQERVQRDVPPSQRLAPQMVCWPYRWRLELCRENARNLEFAVERWHNGRTSRSSGSSDFLLYRIGTFRFHGSNGYVTANQAWPYRVLPNCCCQNARGNREAWCFSQSALAIGTGNVRRASQDGPYRVSLIFRWTFSSSDSAILAFLVYVYHLGIPQASRSSGQTELQSGRDSLESNHDPYRTF